ncbi:porin [Paraburkholderia phenoliruptrix]|uniref:porin n=1 Tax=Paraburkholderia phenoliruptrix TaxID=252970 RepID=UPI00286982D0|nr:porin [Paraburkholderia phenoliruptrix]WMY10880.1 porin [Paraburkholderia phenoliruptrix]
MKKSLLVAATSIVFSATAHAQSSVTLYGIIDVGLVFNNNAGGQKQYFMSSGNIQGSRWGFRGTEGLGGGLSAMFVLENGFSVNNGRLAQGGDEFGRQAYVGLFSTSVGTLTFGRQYDSVVDFTGAYEVAMQWSPYFGAHPGDLDNMNGTNRINNTVKFKSLNYGGFTFGGMYSLGGVAGQFNRNQIWSLGANYTRGPLSLGAAYENVKDPNFSSFGNNATSSATGSNMTASRVYSGYASAKTQQIIVAGGAYSFGAATFGAVYSNTQFKDIGSLAGLPADGAPGDAKFHNVEMNFKYQFTPSLLAGAAYNFTKGYGVNNAKYYQGIVGLDYLLSKRTDVYADAIYQHASGTDSTGAPAVANINFLSASSTSNQVMGIVGMRHKF